MGKAHPSYCTRQSGIQWLLKCTSSPQEAQSACDISCRCTAQWVSIFINYIPFKVTGKQWPCSPVLYTISAAHPLYAQQLHLSPLPVLPSLPLPLVSRSLFPCLWVCFCLVTYICRVFKIPCISDNIWHLSFSSLSLTPSRFIYIVANGKYMFILLNTLLQFISQ